MRRSFIFGIPFLLFWWLASVTAAESRLSCPDLGLLSDSSPPSGGGNWDGSLSVVSLNMHKETRISEVLSDFQAVEALRSADIFLLQEVEHSGSPLQETARDLARRLGMNFVYAPADPIREGMRGLATLSRFPVRDAELIRLKRFDLGYRTRCRVALALTVDLPEGPLRVFNLHLDTRINSEERLEQLQPVIDAAQAFPGRVIVGGDFNTADFLWIESRIPIPFLQRQVETVQKAMTEQGFYTPFDDSSPPTFEPLMLRLDWIFLKNLQAYSWGVEAIRFSDHRALWVRLR